MMMMYEIRNYTMVGARYLMIPYVGKGLYKFWGNQATVHRQLAVIVRDDLNCSGESVNR